jgi:hypothetical protein
MKTIGLCMIVKDEAHIIARCLASLVPLVDYFLLVDTGSRDGTQEVARRFLREQKLHGEVIEEPWRDFAHNRSFALARLRERPEIDYALMIDADEILVYDYGFDAEAFKRALNADLYDIKTVMGDTVYYRPQLTANRKPFHYKAVLHEYLECGASFSRDTALGLHNKPIQDSARNRDPRKYLNDAAALERALAGEADPFLISRYTFYLAQSYRDGGAPELALAAYQRRATQGFWDQEIYVALLQAARLKEQLGHTPAEIVDAYMAAHEALPTRLEALHGAAKFCRLNNRNQQGYLLARQALSIAPPDTGLFVERAVADYALRDEFSILAYWAGHHEESADACRRLLDDPRTPPEHRQRIARNLDFALDKLATPAAGASVAAARRDGEAPDRRRHRTFASPQSSACPPLLLAILAKQKQAVLPFYLDCIEALDYPKSAISLYVRTNNNTDATAGILRDWLGRVGGQYAHVEFDASDVAQNVQQFAVHDWNALRFEVLARIRQASLQRTLKRNCDFYFTADVDNFLRPHALRELVALDLPIVAPLLRHVDPANPYSNYHAAIDANGYYAPCDEYYWILQQRLRGVVQLPVVHCTYLVRADQIGRLSYSDGTARHEYVIFSDSARRNGVQQYFDNRDVYGYLTLDESPVAAQALIGNEVRAALKK